jgi:hypothetical protein
MTSAAIIIKTQKTNQIRTMDSNMETKDNCDTFLRKI